MSNWTQADVDAINAKRGAAMPAHRPPKSKYRNVRTVIDGEKFDSKREANYWLLLKAREKAGEISSLKRQVEFPLYCAAGDRGIQVAVYVADFWYLDSGGKCALHVVDAKGHRTQVYELKKKWLFLQQGISIEEV